MFALVGIPGAHLSRGGALPLRDHRPLASFLVPQLVCTVSTDELHLAHQWLFGQPIGLQQEPVQFLDEAGLLRACEVEVSASRDSRSVVVAAHALLRMCRLAPVIGMSS